MRKMFLAITLLLSFATSAEAKKYTEVRDGKEIVVHTRLAPVLIHKALPPYGLGVHVYEKTK